MRTDISAVAGSPRIQVQVVTYNSADSISCCLDSVLKQTVKVERVIVIDNHSSDRSREIAQAYAGVELLCLPTNTGYAGGHNRGFRIAVDSGMEYVLTLNPDVVLEPDYLESSLIAFERDDLCGGTSGKLLRHTGDSGSLALIDSAGLQMERFFHVRDRGAGKPDGAVFDSPTTCWGICGAAAVYRVAMLADVGQADYSAFDECFFVYKEDVDLCWRARRRGWTFRYVPQAVAFHRRTWKKGAQMSHMAAAHSFANQIALLVRHAPSISFYLALTVVVEGLRFLHILVTRPKVAVQVVRLLVLNWSHHRSERQRLRHLNLVKGSVLNDLCHPCHI